MRRGCTQAPLVGALLLVSACGGAGAQTDPYYTRSLGPTRVAPATELERAVLGAMDSLPVSQVVQVQGQDITADAPYAAASGLSCRRVHFGAEAPGHQAQEKLACSDRRSWFFTPDVLGSDDARSE